MSLSDVINAIEDQLRWIFLAILVFSLISLVWLRLKRTRQQRVYYADPANDSDSIQGTLEELNAPSGGSPWINDERRLLLETHELVERFPTFNGVSEQWINALQIELENHGIDCRVLFQESVPMGVMDALIIRQGRYELFVPRSRLRESHELLAHFRAL